MAAVLVIAGLWTVLVPQTPMDWFADTTPSSGPEGGKEDGKTDKAAAPVTLAPGELPHDPSFDVVRVSRGGTGVIAGRAAPGATVSILADGVAMADVQADLRGDWALIFDNPLPVGGTRLSLVARMPDRSMMTSEDEVFVSVPAQNGKKGEESFIEPVDEGVVAVRMARDGATHSLILQRPSANADYISDVALDAVDYDAAGAAVLIGRGNGRRDVRIYLDNSFLAVVKAGDDGRWAYALPQPLDEQAHRVRLDQVDDKQNIEARFEIGISLPHAPQAAALKAGYAISESRAPEGRLWHIARKIEDGKGAGEAVAYTLVIGPDRTQIKDIKTVYPGQLPGGVSDSKKKK